MNEDCESRDIGDVAPYLRLHAGPDRGAKFIKPYETPIRFNDFVQLSCVCMLMLTYREWPDGTGKTMVFVKIQHGKNGTMIAIRSDICTLYMVYMSW